MIYIFGWQNPVAQAFLYCLAEVKISSSLASILNALTPLCAIIIGLIFFQLKITASKITGVIIGFAGLVLLPFATAGEINLDNLSYASLVLLAERSGTKDIITFDRKDFSTYRLSRSRTFNILFPTVPE